SNPVRLTSGLDDGYPGVSPDGRWVVYWSSDPGRPGIWKVSIDGGTPVLINDRGRSPAPVSPDGKFVACVYSSAPGLNSEIKLAAVPFEGGAPIRTFDIQNGVSSTAPPSIHWSTDGRTILYPSTANNVSNIWSQPLDGSKPPKLTD